MHGKYGKWYGWNIILRCPFFEVVDVLRQLGVIKRVVAGLASPQAPREGINVTKAYGYLIACGLLIKQKTGVFIGVVRYVKIAGCVGRGPEIVICRSVSGVRYPGRNVRNLRISACHRYNPYSVAAVHRNGPRVKRCAV